ncbi:MAG: nucleoside-diphosphate sugar epimerase/dehydratase [Desulfobacterales bacterium]
MVNRFFNKNFVIIFLADLVLLTAALYSSLLIRFEFSIPSYFLASFLEMLPYALLTKIACFYFFDLYRGMWRYTSISDLLNIIKAAAVSSLLIVAFIAFKTRFIGYSRSVFLIDWFLTILFIAGFRLVVRLFFESFTRNESGQRTRPSLVGMLSRKRKNAKKLLIIGAGDCGEKIFREIQNNASLPYRIVGFLDDNRNKIGRKIHGVPVLGRIDEIGAAIKKVQADAGLIAIPSATGQQMREIVEYCKDSGIAFKTVPGYGELIDGRVSVKAIRDVAYRDLLGREAVRLDEKGIGAYIEGNCVMISGAGGSIGSELCRQVCRFKPKRVVLYERAESPLYEIELELTRNFKDIHIVPVLGDIQNADHLLKTFAAHAPRTVFHAAAYKHVPMLEMQPWKAIENNVLGTANLVATVKKFKIDRFVFVSTDKAVRPTNVMGASKRVAEMLIQCQNHDPHSATKFAIVRFGNVVGSVGSVVPLFKRQIETGGPVTVTHPEVTRYFMTIPEACQLILQAGALCSEQVEVFVLDMGQPVKIADMARDLIRLSGFEPDEDIKIDYIGLRPGEKLFEELITEGEGIVPTSHKKIMTLRGEVCSLSQINGKIEKMARMAEEQDAEKIKATLKEIVDDYQPYDHSRPMN